MKLLIKNGRLVFPVTGTVVLQDVLVENGVISLMERGLDPEGCDRVIDASGIPDLVPVLSALAAISPGVTRFIRAERLRLKESDRLAAVSGLLSALGADVSELPDGLLIHGKERLPGGVSVDGCNDHRIVMTAAILASACDAPVVITGAEAVSKSYPAFFADLNQLGGKTDVI